MCGLCNLFEEKYNVINMIYEGKDSYNTNELRTITFKGSLDIQSLILVRSLHCSFLGEYRNFEITDLRRIL